ncbi:MAG: hypothetical protein M3524_03200, partial [Actinomycetota bacterium]|nr:hypothetical protein [Actinomycetota bacterium]
LNVSVRARLRDRSGRKLFMVAEMTHGDEVICDAEGLFITIPPERLGLPPDAAEVDDAERPWR